MDLVQLQRYVEKLLPQVDYVLGWEMVPGQLRTRVLYIRQQKDIARLIWNPLCSCNLVTYLIRDFRSSNPPDKVGILLKGCDALSLAQLVDEGEIDVASVKTIGIVCSGIIDEGLLGNQVEVEASNSMLQFSRDSVIFSSEREYGEFFVTDLLRNICKRCTNPIPASWDYLVGNPANGVPSLSGSLSEEKIIETLEVAERWQVWNKMFSSCLRCNACRNFCPLARSEEFKAHGEGSLWLGQRVDAANSAMYHFIRVVQMAGRCTGCGECDRVCPAHIPVSVLHRKMAAVIKDVSTKLAGDSRKVEASILAIDLWELEGWA